MSPPYRADQVGSLLRPAALAEARRRWKQGALGAERLKEMEAQGLVLRKVLSERPVAVSYELTPFGRSALSLLDQLKDWAEEHGI